MNLFALLNIFVAVSFQLICSVRSVDEFSLVCYIDALSMIEVVA